MDHIKILRRLAVAAEGADPEARAELGAELRAACLEQDALAALAAYFSKDHEDVRRALAAPADEDLPEQLRKTIDRDAFRDAGKRAAVERKLRAASDAAARVLEGALRVTETVWTLHPGALAETLGALPPGGSLGFVLPDHGEMVLDVARARRLLRELAQQRVAVHVALARDHREQGKVTARGWSLVVSWFRPSSRRHGKVRLFSQGSASNCDVVIALECRVDHAAE
jgi:hypothetical protein